MTNTLSELNELNDRVITLYRQGRYPEAIKASKKVLKIARDTCGPDHLYVVTIANNLAILDKIQDKKAGYGQKAARRPSKSNIFFVNNTPVLKLIIILFFLAFAGSFDGSAILFFHRSGPVSASASLEEESHLPYYRVKAGFFPQNKKIEGEEEIVFECAEPVKEIKLNLYFNRYKNNNLDRTGIRRYAFKQGIDRGYIDIQRVSCEGIPVSFEEKGELLRVFPKEGGFSPGKHSLKIGFEVKIPFIADRSGGNEEGIYLGNWLPTLSVDSKHYEPTEIGDPFLNFSSTYEVFFTVPGNYELVLSNVEKVREDESGKIYQGKLEQVRDLPVFFNRAYNKSTAEAGGTEINYYSASTDNHEKEVLDTAQKAMAYFQNNVGEYPWKQLNIIENDMYLDGMEYSTMVLISAKAVKNNLAGTVFHEVGHQWFYNIIGNDQYNAPFVDEGPVEFFTSYVLNGKEPRFWPDPGGFNKNLGDFTSWQKYRDVHYQGGAKLFENFYFHLGKEEFEKAVREYYNRYRFCIVSPEEFKQFYYSIPHGANSKPMKTFDKKRK